jgi:hypothetical protein
MIMLIALPQIVASVQTPKLAKKGGLGADEQPTLQYG